MIDWPMALIRLAGMMLLGKYLVVPATVGYKGSARQVAPDGQVEPLGDPPPGMLALKFPTRSWAVGR